MGVIEQRERQGWTGPGCRDERVRDIEPGEIECEQGCELRQSLCFCDPSGSDERSDDWINEHDAGGFGSGQSERERAMPDRIKRQPGVSVDVVELCGGQIEQRSGIEREHSDYVNHENGQPEPGSEL